MIEFKIEHFKDEDPNKVIPPALGNMKLAESLNPLSQGFDKMMKLMKSVPFAALPVLITAAPAYAALLDIVSADDKSGEIAFIIPDYTQIFSETGLDVFQ